MTDIPVVNNNHESTAPHPTDNKVSSLHRCDVKISMIVETILKLDGHWSSDEAYIS